MMVFSLKVSIEKSKSLEMTQLTWMWINIDFNYKNIENSA